jgi:hypothetical protein
MPFYFNGPTSSVILLISAAVAGEVENDRDRAGQQPNLPVNAGHGRIQQAGLQSTRRGV